MTRGLSGQSPANIMQHLKGVDFPAKKTDLERQAKKNGAPEEILEALKDLPEEDNYHSSADVMKAFGEEKREQKTES
jgi:hypothetical protein